MPTRIACSRETPFVSLKDNSMACGERVISMDRVKVSCPITASATIC